MRADGSPEGGAVAADGATNEWKFNRSLALLVQDRLRGRKIESVVIDSYGPGGYSTAMRALRRRLEAMPSIRAAVELHFNSGPPTAKGHEWLYWRESRAGHALATALDRAMREHCPWSTPRGVKPRDREDRGAGFLLQTPVPAVIAEPFFGSNPQEWAMATAAMPMIAEAMAAGISVANRT